MKALSLLTISITLLTRIEAKTLLFPDPQQVDWLGTAVTFARHFQFQNLRNSHVDNATKRYWNIITKERWVPVQVSTDKSTVKPAGDELVGIHFNVTDNNAKLDYGVDESYVLNVPENGGYATIDASTWVGAIRALETFSQLVESSKDYRLIVHSAHIKDAPIYPHRGILLDTSRNFYPVDDILRILDAQSYNKMNVLHWHATDSQSWPLYFRSHPELSEKGAYSTKEVYTPSDVQKIISYAEERGIRVILELDMPAHTASIGASHPDYLLCANEFWNNYAAEPPAGQLDPLSDRVYQLAQDIIQEAALVFPDSFYHTGGDEIKTSCWEVDKSVNEYTAKRGITTKELWFEWTNKLLDFVNKETRKRPIIWEDPIKDGGSYPKNTVVQTWLADPSQYTALGHDVIVSNYDYFYLDCGRGDWLGNREGGGVSWCPYNSWQRIYSYDLTAGVNKSHKGKILGGELAIWGEQAGPTVIDGLMWPRSAAAAELYWSGSYDTNGNKRTVKSVSERFYDWVYRLQARGINAEPTQPKYCVQHPGACNVTP